MVEAVLDDGGFVHGFTYAGNPLACATGVAVLEEIERQGMMDNAVKRRRNPEGAADGADEPLSDDRRRARQGLLLAFELVADRTTMEPLPAAMGAYEKLVDIAYEAGLIIYSRRSRGGYSGDHFLVAPPMITTEGQVEDIIEMLTTALDRFQSAEGLG